MKDFKSIDQESPGRISQQRAGRSSPALAVKLRLEERSKPFQEVLFFKDFKDIILAITEKFNCQKISYSNH